MNIGRIGYEQIAAQDATAAARSWWDDNSTDYFDDNGAFLKESTFFWGPEGVTEEQLQLLTGSLHFDNVKILEIGSGAAQCSRWLKRRGAHVLATDLSFSMLQHSHRIDSSDTSHTPVPLVQADAQKLPFCDDAFDVVFTSFGAIPFVADVDRIHSEVFRVLRPGGRWVYSTTHPARWMFPDDPTRHGMSIQRSYFAREPYVEFDANGKVEYAEFHRTVGDHVRSVVTAGFALTDLIEPEWPAHNTNVWGGWGPERGAYLPGTLIVVADKA
ncbi:class I SAM-dependent methyltransferase [Timonella sp. A28]|uniref:class I SAM-dependent methyltransferase n=1 Tax=Timonella sp. A28 TaxID=3442640 RepID=UPI003EBA2450